MLVGGVGFLGYVYGLYPVLVRLLPARRRAVRGEPLQPRMVSVVLAARGGGNRVAQKVRAMLGQLEGLEVDGEVVVVLDGPDDEARAALAGLADMRVHTLQAAVPVGKAECLNRGVAQAGGDVLVFVDARQEVAAGAVARLVEAVAVAGWGAVSGALRFGAGSPPGLLGAYWSWEKRLREREAARDSAVGVTGALYALRREAWSPIRRGVLLDDLWVPMQAIRAGWRIGFAPDAVVTDRPPGTEAEEYRRKVRTLTGNYQILAWMPWLLSPVHNRVWWEFLSHKVLRLLTPVALAAAAAGGTLVIARAVGWGVVGGAAVVVGVLGAANPRRPRVAARGARALRTFAWMQAALLAALGNALRGRWEVWSTGYAGSRVSEAEWNARA